MLFSDGKTRWTAMAQELLEACKKTAFDGTVIFTPDGVGNYDALWVRDFGYMVEYCGDLMEPEELRRCIEFILRGQRGRRQGVPGGARQSGQYAVSRFCRLRVF